MSYSTEGQIIFRQGIDTIFNKWPALQIAIEHGMGGAEAREKEHWMKDMVQGLITENPSIDPSQLEDYISDILNNEFDTLAEDGSVEEITNTLIRFYNWCGNGEQHKVLAELCKLEGTPKPNVVKAKELVGTFQNAGNGPETTEITGRMEDLNIEADDWTLVTNKKKK